MDGAWASTSPLNSVLTLEKLDPNCCQFTPVELSTKMCAHSPAVLSKGKPASLHAAYSVLPEAVSAGPLPHPERFRLMLPGVAAYVAEVAPTDGPAPAYRNSQVCT